MLAKRVFDKLPWKQTEDQKLVHYYAKYPDNWKKISSFIGHHDETECRNRFNYLQQNKIGTWSQEETKKLINLYKKYGKNWKVISNQFKDRTPQQIKDKVRSLNKLNETSPNLFEELINMYLRYGLEASDNCLGIPQAFRSKAMTKRSLQIPIKTKASEL